ncbi:MAG: hypothetical protein Q7N50_02800 [Armatimonadota bacterium]|nr:hypothetical protein [Armatimonadota bacterium]
MTREEIYREIEDTMGMVPTLFKYVPDQYLEQEWNSWKNSMTAEKAIPNKWQALIGLGMQAAVSDKYGIFWCAQAARMSGATEEEIREVAYMARMDMGWGPYVRANQMDFEEFKREVTQIMEHMKSQGKFEAERIREKVSM